MHFQKSNVIRVSVEIPHFFHLIVIVHPNPHVVARGQEPLLTGNKLGTSHRKFAQFERLYATSTLVIPNQHISGIQRGQRPTLARVDIDTLHTLRTGGKFLFDIEPEWLNTKTSSSTTTTTKTINITTNDTQN